jgi:hypothetical protein
MIIFLSILSCTLGHLLATLRYTQQQAELKALRESYNMVPKYPDLSQSIAKLTEDLLVAAGQRKSCLYVDGVRSRDDVYEWEKLYGGTELAEQRRKEAMTEFKMAWEKIYPDLVIKNGRICWN